MGWIASSAKKDKEDLRKKSKMCYSCEEIMLMHGESLRHIRGEAA